MMLLNVNCQQMDPIKLMEAENCAEALVATVQTLYGTSLAFQLEDVERLVLFQLSSLKTLRNESVERAEAYALAKRVLFILYWLSAHVGNTNLACRHSPVLLISGYIL